MRINGRVETGWRSETVLSPPDGDGYRGPLHSVREILNTTPGTRPGGHALIVIRQIPAEHRRRFPPEFYRPSSLRAGE